MSKPEVPKGPPQKTVRAKERKRPHSLEGSDELLSERDRKAFGELIDLAERTLAESDGLLRQIYFSIGGIIFLTIAAIAVIIATFGDTSSDELLDTTGAVLLLIAIAASYVAGAAIYFPLARRLRRESKAFREVMDIVHELHEGLKEELSPLERAEIRIRLSRLDN